MAGKLLRGPSNALERPYSAFQDLLRPLIGINKRKPIEFHKNTLKVISNHSKSFEFIRKPVKRNHLKTIDPFERHQQSLHIVADILVGV